MNAGSNWYDLRVDGIAGGRVFADLLASIEGEKECLAPVELSRHPDFIGIDDKMHQRAAFEGKELLARIARLDVLLPSIGAILPGELVL